MLRSLQISLVASLTVILSTTTWAGPKPKTPSTHVYASPNKEGLIGTTEESPSDNPADNIFHVQMDQTFCSSDNVWLEYELEGVEDHTAVARSINDHLAVGGHLIKKRRGWALQQERVDGTWLRQGDNVFRFTMPEGAQHSYRVRNLKITVTANTESEEQIIINQPSKNYYDGMIYVKGFLPENNRENIRLKIEGKFVSIFKGEFEAEVAMVKTNCNVEMELIFPDGTTQCKAISYEKMESADFYYAVNSTVFYKEQFIDCAKPDSVFLQGANLKLSTGALANASLLSITTLRDIDIPALDAGMVNVTANHFGYRFLPHGTEFQKEAKLRVPFDGTKIPDGYTDKDIRTYFFDEQTHHWIALNSDTLLANTNEVVSRVTHFTDYINAIIKVPESPEVEAYNSTSMKGIKAANPTAAVNLINPPQANNSGSASLSYPINIPGGRNGVQPQLAVSYNSSGGNGWIGLGWNLTLPSVGIETRWGVPRYDATQETETYSMNGEMLTPVAHRGTLVNRSTGDKQFYPRIEGAFHKIIRHGNDPKSYWWEVTDKSGTRYFYGGSPETQLDKTAVLRDDEAHDAGNIAHWSLTETRDLNGNFVKYHYAKVSNTGLANGTVPGYQLYIDNITYTGHNGAEGQYKVVFTRQQGRPDVTISANLGFKEVTADLLQKIDVQFSGKSVRSYVLNYKTGEFYKSLLSTISEYDAAGKLFNTHTFDYYDDAKSGASLKPFKNTESWTVPSDGVTGGLIVSKAGFDDKASAFGGNKSTDVGAGMTVTAGFFDGILFAKSNSIGGSFGFSQSGTNGKVLMIDINGDGLSDKVIADGNGFRYRPNLSHGGTPKFGDPIAIKNAGDFFVEKSTTTNFGFEAQGGYGNFSAFVGAGQSKTTSVTSVYFTDVNGDGLPDLISNGLAYFNHMDDQGVITFSPSSTGTPNPILNSGSVSSDIFQIDPAELQADIDANPLHDVVRMWRAPYAGQVAITAPVQLVSTGEAPPNADGVQVSIQHNGDNAIWTQRIQANDFSTHTPTGVSNLSVAKGDRIYFRVQSVFNGEADLVQWSPVIQYVGKDSKVSDANGNKLYRFDAQKEFVLSAPMEVGTPIAGTIRIEGAFQKPITTDSIHVEIVHKTASNTIVEFKHDFAWNETSSTPITLDLNVAQHETFIFTVTSKTNVDWPSLLWKPHIYYTTSSDPSVTELYRNGQPVVNYYPVPNFSIYANALNIAQPFVVTKKTDTIRVKPLIQLNSWPDPFGQNPLNGKIIFSVKRRDTLVGKQMVKVVNGQVSTVDSLKIKTHKNDTLYLEYHLWNDTLAFFLNTAKSKVTMSGKDTTVDASVYTKYKQLSDMIYGTLYRQWGHFAYNGNRDRANNPIVESDLKLNDKLQSSQYQSGDVTDPSALNSAYDPSKDNFIMLFAKGEQQVWQGYDNLTYLNGTQISSSRMGADDLTPVSGASGSVRGINKISKTTNTSFSGGAGFDGVGNGSVNTNNGQSKLVSDFMDLNGDRYPDIVTDKGVQYTNPTGELQSTYQNFISGNITSTTTTSTGASAGGFVKITPKGSATNAKATRSDVGSAKVSGTISVNYGQGTNSGNFSWQDINGDGLPDLVYSNGTVQLNLGYKLAPTEPWMQQGLQVSKSTSEGAGLGFSIGAGSESASIGGGIGLSRSDNDIQRSLQDLNGDGLIDDVSNNNGVKVRLNTGNGFGNSQWQDWTGASKINFSSTTGESANVSFTGCIPLVPPFVVAKLCFNPSVNAGESMSKDQVQINDVDGDGYPDYLQSTNDGELNVSRSTIGRTNLLKSVQRPLGASFTLDYQRLGNTYDLPHSVWTMTSVKTFDGFAGDGADTLLTTFSYDKGIYDRHERENYGFAKVTTQTHDTQNNNLVYATVTQAYANNNYYSKGLLLSETTTDGFGRNYMVKTSTYDLKDIIKGTTLPPMSLSNDDGNAFPALVNTVEQFFEGQPSVGKSTSMQYSYDLLGNVTNYTDNGDVGTEDDLNATIAYYNVASKYIMGTPQSIIVKNGSTLLRKRESVIDQNTGEVTQIKQYLDDKNIAVHDMQYDSYGNLTTMTRPANSTGQRLAINYVYDAVVNTYPVTVSNSYGYTSAADYDFKFGQVLSSTDLNGNKIIYTLDDVGRIITILGPYENGGANTYTIKFEYHVSPGTSAQESPAWALTSHFDPQNSKNDLQTSIFVDGLGRVLQTKKDVAIFSGDGKPDTEMMGVSGRMLFDAFGRTTKAYYPTTESVGSQGIFNKTFDSVAPTSTTYDVMNRTLTVTLPDGAITKTDYGFDSDRDGKLQFSTKTTDANGKLAEQFTDVRGRVTSVKNFSSGNSVWASFKYNAINEQIEATDDLKHTTFSTYDNLGRKTTRIHPDAGTSTYNYDLVGNMTTLVTANLATVGLSIGFTYDFERLMQISYPLNPENNVKLTYGVAGESDNRAGKVVLQEDATGAQEFFYGKLGEIVKLVRTVVIPQHDEQTFVTEWQTDTWCRLTGMTYPDGETVTYNYNAGGLLHDMSGKKKGNNFAYVNQLGYDKFEQRVFLGYGNGTKTTYTYEDDRRRLKNMIAQTTAQRAFMDNRYTYDKVNNILDLKNNAPVPAPNLMGGPSEYKYSYDDLYRLVSANGNYKGGNDEEAYALAMSYNSVGSILTKNQSHTKQGNVQKKTTYSNSYNYGDTQPHAPIHIGQQTYTYDANGNQLGWTDDKSGQRRNIVWDEQNRIRAIEDNGAYNHYIYDAAGERVLKGKSSGQRIFINGNLKGGSGGMGNYTVYVNPYIVLNSGGYTKHFFIEGQRIVSKLGGGWDNNGQASLKTAGNGKVDYNNKAQQLITGIVKNLKFLGADGQILTAGKSGKVPPGQVKGTGNVAESFRYFFHPDHLGSTSYVTDASGEVYQHVEYFAFGETFVDEHSNTNRTPYLFNGKELDEETGLYYYGARYYDPKVSLWVSVDPKADQSPEWSPFNYTYNNPMRFVDPDGKFVSGDKTTNMSSFVGTLKKWQSAASAMSIRTMRGSRAGTIIEGQNHALIRVFDADFRATKQIVNQVGDQAGFSYNKAFGKYVDVGLPLDVAHFFKMASLAQDYPEFAVRMAYVSEEFDQTKDKRPAGRTSAFAPEDLFSNELGLIFGSEISQVADFSTELGAYFKEINTLFTTNELKGGKYLTDKRIDRLRSIAEKYYGTRDLTKFGKNSTLYKLENIKKINDNAEKRDYPFYKEK
ncbi:MAG TPA: SpvB/TcaC N-terminal domain-containing protein [Cyclobacteriaceae bacterium]|jgi:RHS repeat-associated protein|nr:SpvB/TcaC N-terminal domain-containing protein [Cyclobacteriaceae bacterium]